MPELPEVETVKNALLKAVDKANITKVSIYNNRFRKIIPDDFARRIEGTQIAAIRRKAKYLLLELDNGLSVIWHLGMSGKVKISDFPPEKKEKHDHVMIETDKATLVFNDARRFGMLTYAETSGLGRCSLFAHIGTDPFDERLDGLYLYNKLQKKKIPIKAALLDQSIVNGAFRCGNRPDAAGRKPESERLRPAGAKRQEDSPSGHRGRRFKHS